MGKRKRRTDKNKTPISPPTPSDMAPHSHQMDSLSKEKSFRPVGTSTVKSQSSNMEIVDTSMKPPNAQQSPTHHHHHYHHQQQQQQHNYNHQNHQNRTLLSRHPRNYYGRQYSRRNSANHAANTSTYHRKGQTPLRNDKLSFKLAASTFPVKSQSHSADYRERAYRRPERIRSSLLGMETGISSSDSADVMKMVCGICEKLLRKKPYIIENTTLSATDLSVVAVLVCGHLFHADCLETRTALQDRRDPPCPTCIRSTHIDLV